jgi:SAM-dependent methyltransferase
MSITKNVDDPIFFGPGYSMPFNPWNPEFTLFYVTLFGIASSLLAPRKGETIIDSGCGYAWTSEWLHRSGLQTVGVDIARVYLEIGIARMGSSRPHLIVGDVENLPLASACADAVLACESFHHIPDRPRAMAGYDRILRKRGRVVLAEPDEQHATSEVAVDAMTKYGILERGMGLADVRAYVAGTALTRVEQMFVPALRLHDVDRMPTVRFLTKRRLVDGNLFVIRRPVPLRERIADLVEHRREYWIKLKHRVKMTLIRR